MRPRLFLLLLAPWLLTVGPAAAHAQSVPAYDLILRNGRVVDGTGSPWYRADVAIAGGRIAAVGPALSGAGARELDLAEQVVAPGFIDVHSHGGGGIFDVPTADNYLRQGVTSFIAGPDGSSELPIGPWLERVAALPRTVNVGTMVGQGTIRGRVVGSADRRATPAELEAMKALAEQAMRDGAFGLSTGLFYVPGAFTPTEEVIELARVVGRLGGFHKSHMRDEASRIVESVRETIRIGEEGGLPTQITHHKVIGPGYWGASEETLRLVDEARARGVDVTIDQYPYTASATSVHAALLPKWAQEGGLQQTRQRLADPVQRARIRDETARIIELERGGGDPDNVVVSSCAWDPSLAGRTLRDVIEMRGLEQSLQGAAEAAFWLTEQGGCGGIFHAIGEDDLLRIMRHPATMIASDGGVIIHGQARPHPRSYGTFARVLSHYVRERGVLTREEAVRKMTSLPAQRLGLQERGLLRPGMVADLVVLDPPRVRDPATFAEPHQYAEGVSLVVVSGEIVLEEGRITDARPGRVLYGSARR
ncbi:MAG TPA: D-aminoacylase [Longimicrobiales bacterium]|nr:D-aminoacylase [Longimicrobiales bacterium]